MKVVKWIGAVLYVLAVGCSAALVLAAAITLLSPPALGRGIPYDWVVYAGVIMLVAYLERYVACMKRQEKIIDLERDLRAK